MHYYNLFVHFYFIKTVHSYFIILTDDKIKELINNIIGGNQAPSFVTDILNKALEQLNQGAGSALVAPMINKVLESYSKDNSLSSDMSELFNITSNSGSGLSDIAGNIINTLIKK